MNRMLQHFGWATVVLASALAVPAQAGIITQQIELTVVDAVDGNSFGLTNGWVGSAGSFTYDSADIDAFWSLTPAAGLFDFSFFAGSTAFTAVDDSNYPEFPLVVFADELAQSVLTFDLEVVIGSLSATIFGLGDGQIWFEGVEDGYRAVSGSLSFSVASVDEPAMLSLFLLLAAVPLVCRRC